MNLRCSGLSKAAEKTSSSLRRARTRGDEVALRGLIRKSAKMSKAACLSVVDDLLRKHDWDLALPVKTLTCNNIIVCRQNLATCDNPLVVCMGADFSSCEMPLSLGALICFSTSEDKLLVNQKQFKVILQDQKDGFSPDLYVEENQYPMIVITDALAEGSSAFFKHPALAPFMKPRYRTPVAVEHHYACDC